MKRCKRPGFTLIELMVVAALLVILTTMAFTGFRYLTAVMNRSISTTRARENLSVVMDQVTKELRETVVVQNDPTVTNDGRGVVGVTLPTWTSTADTSRGVGADSSPDGVVLEFFAEDSDGHQHRIRYGLTVPANGLAQGFWADSSVQPYEITYCNNTWNAGWLGGGPQPMTDQVVTGFSITRSSWSSYVLQITLEAQVPGLGRTGHSTVRLIGLVTLRQ